jgi:hypothetical protein
MKNNYKSCSRVSAAIGLVMGLMVVSVTPAWAGNSNPSVIPPNAEPHGLAYGEWSAKWWQWALSLPVNRNPFFDETGCANGNQGQHGPVWFLTGVINTSGTASRDCTVPEGKAIFFPVLNYEADNFFNNPPFIPPKTIKELREYAANIINGATDLIVELDGKPIKIGKSYRVQSAVFGVHLPDNNIEQYFGYTAPAGEYAPMVDDGYYVMLAPLSHGYHTLHFHGAIPLFGFTLDIRYNLAVEHRD